MNDFSNHLPFLSTLIFHIFKMSSSVVKGIWKSWNSDWKSTVPVKNKDKKRRHMEWMVQCDKLVIKLLTNRVPPTSIQVSILAMVRSFFHGHDIVCELPCVKSIQYMRSTLLQTTKSLAVYRPGSADSWKQLIT